MITWSSELESSLILACSYKPWYEGTNLGSRIFSLVWAAIMSYTPVCWTIKEPEDIFLLRGHYYTHFQLATFMYIRVFTTLSVPIPWLLSGLKADRIAFGAELLMCTINLAYKLALFDKRLNEPYVNTSVNPHFISLGVRALFLPFRVTCQVSDLQLKHHLTLSVFSDLLSQDED